MSQRAIIDFYNEAGDALLGDNWDIFSGSQINRNDTSVTQRFRVYNNFSGVVDIVDTENVMLHISADGEFLTNVVKKSEYNDFTQNIIDEGRMEIRCTLSSETGLVPPSGSTFVPFVYDAPFSGSGFDEIMASGSFNYNEYEIRFVLPSSGTSGSWNASGSAHPAVFVSWDNVGFNEP